MGFGRKNHVKIDPTNYSLMLLGEAKIGKSSVIKEVLEKLVGSSGYLFAEIGRERGADAIENINYINCPEWSMDYDDDDNAIGWEDLVDDICENKTSDPDYKDLKVLVIDTYDQYIDIAIEQAILLWNRKNPDKRAETLNQSWGGFGSNKKVIDLMFEQIDRLNRVGVKVWWIGHIKTKSVTDVVTGETYDVLTSDQQQNYFLALKKNLHFLGMAYIDREIVSEKTGRRNLVTKKEETKSVVKSEARKIRFRDDSYSLDAGSRFSNIVDVIDLDADQFIAALKDAIKSEAEKDSSVSIAQRVEKEAELEQKRMAEIAAAEERNKTAKEVKAVVDKIIAFIQENKADMSKIKPILAECKKIGVTNPTEITSLEDALKIAELIK